MHRINERKSWFFQKIHKIGKPLGKLTKKQKETIHIHKINYKCEVLCMAWAVSQSKMTPAWCHPA